jgi:triosephosphate isomerase
VIRRAAEALAGGGPPPPGAARQLLAAARDIDREFLARIGSFPVRIEIRYDQIEPLRLRRIELGLDTAYRILDAWRRRCRLRDALAPSELERRMFEMLQLYADETQALSHSVRLPGILAPVRERVARRLREAMTHAARTLARDAARRSRQGSQSLRRKAAANAVRFRRMARTRLVAGNWKMHGSRAFNRALVDALLKSIEGVQGVECAVCVPFPYLGQVAEQLAGTPIAWGAQNVSEHAQGAYTGEVSAAMLAEFGCRYVLVGHSERRQLHGESDAQVAAKFAAAQAAGITPILCVGETLDERDAGNTEAVVARQLNAILKRTAFENAVLAYEPVWAIGTGRNATPEQAQAVHAFLRKKVPVETLVLYGGSVKPQNAPAIFAMPDVDGGLIGGASLVARDFLAIVEAASVKVTT